MKRHYDFSKGKRGPVFTTEPGKTRITIRVDNDILEYFRNKAGGGNYQTLMNDALREYISGKHLEAVLRDTVRSELREFKRAGA